ncbi:hypothetical protein BBF96_02925 [Anoxybacter fermentans]|uniref:ACT domain-containing protein n=1 Tax=Anoxybacter fermentans TaxID=1323375 RepID=A0A3Q9HPC9_9FIRM|nr:DUF3388 domain-containing protein [Anoxybacter fermentans]AZR72436.1 hypothetical protein BBF96_02925 [Anoxybacter fermentans]
MNKYYLEYKILNDRPGLLGDVASLIGMLKLNIQTISSIEGNKRGLLLNFNTMQQLESLYLALKEVQDLEVKIFREPQELDLLALKHGKRIQKTSENPPTFRFERKELDYLIDFLGGRLTKKSDIFVGFRGSPRVGKTETAIAASVHANKPWILISSTLLKKIVRTNLDNEILENGTILIIDAITTFYRSFPEHIEFVKNLLNKKIPRIVEHPDVLVRETNIKLSDFDLIIELNNDEDKENEEGEYIKGYGFYSFDIS